MLIVKIIKSVEKIFFPNVCPICGEVIGPKDKICGQCVDKVKIIEEPKCQKCGKQLCTDEKLLCQDCNDIDHVFDRGICVFEYTEEFRHSLYKFKYDNKRCYSDLFGYVAAKKYKKTLRKWKVEKILPVPMYSKKQQRRGYNQAETFGQALAEYTGIGMDAKCLARVRDTKPQKGLNKEERHQNLQNAFGVDKERLQGTKSVLLVDDIYTTGSTVDGCARVLKSAGVEKVYCMCVAGGKDKN